MEGQSNGICNHENTRSYNQFDPTCRISGFGAIVCTDCAYTVSTGYIDPIAHSFTDGFCEYCYLAEDAEITVEYTYDHVLSDGEYSLAFLSDGTFTVNATRQTEDGTVEKIYFVGEWSINDSNIIDTYVISINYQRFNVDNDGNLSLYVCDHSEGTYDRTVDPGCETDGYRQLFCMLCHDLISETPIPATGHNFNNGSCDYCGEVESGGEVIDKTVSYGYKDDNLSLTLYSDYTVEGSSIGITSDGMSILDKVVGKWIMHYESNRITVDLNIGSFTFDVVNGHELVLVNENGSEGGEGDSTACNHENIYDETVDPDGCFTDGYIRVICKDCKNVISDMPIPAEHSYDENGICTNCGTEDKNNTIVTPDYNYGIAG